MLVPAFTGLGAPYWEAECRGAIFGLTRNTGPAELARAALESVGYQTRDLMEAMRADWRLSEGGEDQMAEDAVLRVDGGMSASGWAMQFLADILGTSVDRPTVLETTALGAAWLAGMAADFYPSQEEFAKSWSLERRFEPVDGCRRTRTPLSALGSSDCRCAALYGGVKLQPSIALSINASVPWTLAALGTSGRSGRFRR